MTRDQEDRMWLEAMKAKGHMPIVDEDGDLDIFALEADTHNGPGCAACGWSCCMYCTKVEDIPACDVVVVEPVGTSLEPPDNAQAKAASIVDFLWKDESPR